MLVCPGCNEAKTVRPAQRMGSFDGLFRFLRLYPYRCDLCTKRFRRFGKQTLAVSDEEPALPLLSDPSAFTPLRFEGRKAPEIPRQRPLAAPPLRRDVPADSALGTPTQPVFPTHTQDRQPSEQGALINPLAMEPVDIDASDLPVRLPEFERFDPLFLIAEDDADLTPMRAEGDHIFNPLAMNSDTTASSIDTASGASMSTSFLTSQRSRLAERWALRHSAGGRALRSAKRRRWLGIVATGTIMVALSALISLIVFKLSARPSLQFLWFCIAASNLVAGTIMAVAYPRFNRDDTILLPPLYLQLGAGWLGFTMLVHFAITVVLLPLFAGRGPNLRFYVVSGPWLWLSYGALVAAAGLGWLVNLRRPGKIEDAEG